MASILLARREINRIRGLLGTAVNVQSMVYGNLNDNSGTGEQHIGNLERKGAAAQGRESCSSLICTGWPRGCVLNPCLMPASIATCAPAGVCFTRNPATGEKKLYGEYLPNAQGEDVVAGIRTPLDVQHVSLEWLAWHTGPACLLAVLVLVRRQPAANWARCRYKCHSMRHCSACCWALSGQLTGGAPPLLLAPTHAQMADNFAVAYEDLVANTNLLEKHMRDMQDCEFTVQDGVLFMLQTRNGKRTGPAALQVAVAMAGEGMVSREEAVLMVEPRHLDQLLHPMFKGRHEVRHWWSSRELLGTGPA